MARVEFTVAEIPGPKGRYTETMAALLEAEKQGKAIKVPKDVSGAVQSAAVKTYHDLYHVHGQQSDDGLYRMIWLTKK